MEYKGERFLKKLKRKKKAHVYYQGLSMHYKSAGFGKHGAIARRAAVQHSVMQCPCPFCFQKKCKQQDILSSH